MDLKMEEFLT